MALDIPVQHRIRGFTVASAETRYRCTTNVATFVSICAQHYLAHDRPRAAQAALEYAAMLTLLGGDIKLHNDLHSPNSVQI